MANSRRRRGRGPGDFIAFPGLWGWNRIDLSWLLGDDTERERHGALTTEFQESDTSCEKCSCGESK